MSYSRPIQTSTSTALYTTLAATTTTTTTSTTTEPSTTSAEARQFVSFSTVSTVVPQLTAEHTSPLASLLNGDILEQDRTVRPSTAQYANTAEEEHDEEQELEHDQDEDEQQLHGDELEEEDDETNVVGRSSNSANAVAEEEEEDEHEQDDHEHDEAEDEDEQAAELHHQQALAAGQDTDAVVSTLPEDIPVEQKLKQITKEIEQLSGGAGDRELRVDSRQSFLSLSDLIKNIRPAEKVVPQIDSSYANTMRVLAKRISVQKCDEYRRVISSKRGVISLTLNPKPIYYQSYNCSNVVELIVGGEAAKNGEFPHHALLGYPSEDDGPTGPYSFSCGGSLISDRFILTAAHCFSYGDPEIVRLGEYDLKVDSTSQLDFGIAEIIRHPSYRNSRSYHDIALIRLNETVLFSKIIRPACLWTNPALNLSRFVATGFGKLEEGSIELSTNMMKVQLDLFPSSDCGELFRDNRNFREGIKEGQLCVGSIIGGKDTCQGDSGGPLQTITEPRSCIYNIVGVTSTGAACGVGNSKAIYTNVAHYLDWIEQVVWGQ
ncbi:serine protease snake-like [Anopheles maculipalpis]|uniref:serine protease snake-like n=1 Tax=Anopheles maculipalpis TaxID=1496333 RepID=UPI002158B882|nr:serine protease snake-like [Anopheles maculipalpis]